MGSEDAVESLHGDGEDGDAGAGERDLSQGQQPRHQARVDLVGKQLFFFLIIQFYKEFSQLLYFTVTVVLCYCVTIQYLSLKWR